MRDLWDYSNLDQLYFIQNIKSIFKIGYYLLNFCLLKYKRMKRNRLQFADQFDGTNGRKMNYDEFHCQNLSEQDQLQMAIQMSLSEKNNKINEQKILDNLQKALYDLLNKKQQFYKQIVDQQNKKVGYQITEAEEKIVQDWLAEMEENYPNWRQKMLNPYIKAIKLNKITNKYEFQTTQNDKESCLEQSHLRVPFYVYLVQKYSQDITFSLDPDPDEKLSVDHSMPKNMVKNHFVDIVSKKKIIGDTKFGDFLFQADFLMKQLMLGVDQVGNKFVYPPQLFPIFNKQFSFQENKSNLSRYYLKVKQDCQMIEEKQNGNYIQFTIKNPIIEVEARQMEIIDGKMKDTPIQDNKSKCYQQAKSFSDNYDLIASYYPIFKTLKGCMLGIALAKAVKNKITNISKEDQEFIQTMYKQEKLKYNSQKVPTIFGTVVNQNFIIKGADQGGEDPLIEVYKQTNIQYVSGGVSCSFSKNNMMTSPKNNINLSSLNESRCVYENKNSFEKKAIDLGRQYATYQAAESLTTKFASKIAGFRYSVATALPLITATNFLLQSECSQRIAQFACKSALKASQYLLKYGPAFSKTLAKKIPFISAGFGLFQGIKRVISGQYEMALAQVCSGLLGCAPGAGTILSTAIDARILANDMTN